MLAALLVGIDLDIVTDDERPGAPTREEAFEVTVSGISSGLSGAPTSHTYQVTPIDVNSRVFLDEWSFSGGVGVRLRWLPE